MRLALSTLLLLAACGSDSHDGDAAADASPDVSSDATSDASDAAPDTGADCDALRRAHTAAFEEAVVCNPGTVEPQCTGMTIIPSSCGCDWAANDDNGESAAEAIMAFAAVEAAGCVPPTCPDCTTDMRTFACTNLPVGTMGTCEPR